ncbi:MAG: hypothetical protein ACLP62_02780 [Acidimicrobiales bacterium]
MAVEEAGKTVGERLVESLETGETSVLDAVHRFVDTVNNAFPDLGEDDGPRKKIIDAAFKMTEELVGTVNDVVRQLMKASQDAVSGSDK